MERALRGIDSELEPLRVISTLRRRLDPSLAREAAELHEARRRAKRRFPCSENGFFTRKGVEQMSRASVAAARAAWIAERAGACRVVDATCGVGADSVALARAGLFTVSVDRDPRSALCASANLRALGLPDRVVIGDALALPLRPRATSEARCGGGGGVDVLLLDPDRRAEGKRSLEPEDWSPPLSEALGLALRFPGACIKLAPASDPARIRAALRQLGGPGSAAAGAVGSELAPAGAERVPSPWHLEWVDDDRELCELTLWTGVLALPGEGAHSCLSLRTHRGPPGANRLSGAPDTLVSRASPEVSEIRFLAEPNPSVVRSGLLGELANRVGMAPISPEIAWLGGPERPDSPFLTPWKVLDSSTADPKRVRAMLSRNGIGTVAVKTRGHPDRPEVLERRFRGSGERRGLLAVARLERGHAAFLLDPEP